MKQERSGTVLVSTFSLQSMGFITWLVFLVLKLTNVVNWSWFWIWFPLWLPAALGLALWIITFIVIWIILSTDR